MRRTLVCCVGLLLVAGGVGAEEPAAKAAKAEKAEKELAGMSIVGNDEAPKSLVIVPWKSSELGSALDVSRVLDDGRQPVDRDVFARELDYYQIRAESPAADGSGAQ
jgi:hypothetical protein